MRCLLLIQETFAGFVAEMLFAVRNACLAWGMLEWVGRYWFGWRGVIGVGDVSSV